MKITVFIPFVYRAAGPRACRPGKGESNRKGLV